MPNEKNPELTNDTDDRLPYEPPMIVAEEVFETLALECINTVGEACNPPIAGS